MPRSVERRPLRHTINPPAHPTRRLGAWALVIAGIGLSAQAEPRIELSSPPITHQVRQGDTLWDIAGKFLRTPLRWPELQRKNGVPVPELLQPGRVLVLVDGELQERQTLRHGGAASVVELSGTAWLQRGEGEPRPLDMHTLVQSGDKLLTERNTFLCLELWDGSRVVMPSSSTVRVTAAEGSRTQLELIGGRIESQVEKQQGRLFDVRTRTASLGVKGTRFRVRDEDGTVSTEVLEGSVQVTSNIDSAQSVLVRDGEGLLLQAGVPLKPQRLLAAPGMTVSNGGATLTIEAVPEARGYRMQVAQDERFSRIVHEATGAEPEFRLPIDLPEGFYFVRVTALDRDAVEGLPREQPIHLAGRTAEAGIGATPMSDGRFDVRWPAVSGQRFVFELARDAEFKLRLIELPLVYQGGVTVGPLTVSGTYHWRARPVEATASGTTTAGPPVMQAGGRIEVPAR
ncbi:MAG: LysM peptidoglycan-binding domain-containing protein [Comamonadaceae bacterium]|nr:MAG: LysM peptidoglycan-binding domain-containing protein [Comamonadaceae bacterium]